MGITTTFSINYKDVYKRFNMEIEQEMKILSTIDNKHNCIDENKHKSSKTTEIYVSRYQGYSKNKNARLMNYKYFNLINRNQCRLVKR